MRYKVKEVTVIEEYENKEDAEKAAEQLKKYHNAVGNEEVTVIIEDTEE